jgi:hypothetical protein
MNGQITTFNKRLDLGEYAVVFSSIEVTDSCYYATGIVGDQPTTTASFFAKFDTLGNELFHTIYQNTEAWVFTLQTNKEGNLVMTPYKYPGKLIGNFKKQNKPLVASGLSSIQNLT